MLACLLFNPANILIDEADPPPLPFPNPPLQSEYQDDHQQPETYEVQVLKLGISSTSFAQGADRILYVAITRL
jgi:hypothetical protein